MRAATDAPLPRAQAQETRRQIFLGARFPSTLVASIVTSLAINTLLCIGCFAVLPTLLSYEESVAAYLNQSLEHINCGGTYIAR